MQPAEQSLTHLARPWLWRPSEKSLASNVLRWVWWLRREPTELANNPGRPPGSEASGRTHPGSIVVRYVLEEERKEWRKPFIHVSILVRVFFVMGLFVVCWFDWREGSHSQSFGSPLRAREKWTQMRRLFFFFLISHFLDSTFSFVCSSSLYTKDNKIRRKCFLIVFNYLFWCSASDERHVIYHWTTLPSLTDWLTDRQTFFLFFIHPRLLLCLFFLTMSSFLLSHLHVFSLF